MKSVTIIMIWAVIVLVAATELNAQSAEEGPGEESEREDVIEFEAVTVADRVPEDPFFSSRSVTVQDDQSLAEQASRTVPEALWNAPGVFVQQTNHGGGSPILRGMIGPQNLILIDGVRLNNSVYRTGPLQYLNLVDPLSIESLEVLRGPGSVLYGSDAMGGVIQVVPLATVDRDTSEFEADGNLLLRSASANLQRTGHVDLSAGIDDVDFLAGATYSLFDDLSAGREEGLQPHSGYDQYSTIGRFEYEIPEGELMGSLSSVTYLMTNIDRAGRTDKLYDRNSLGFYDNTDHLVFARQFLRLRPIETDVTLTLSYQNFFERKDSLIVADDYITEVSATRDEVTVNTLGMDLQLHTWLMEHRLHLQYGGMWYRDWVGADRMTRDTHQPWWEPSAVASYPNDSTYDNFGAFLLVEGDPLSTSDGHILRLGLGYRLHGMGGQAPAREGIEAAEFSHLGHVFLASAQYLFREDATVALTFSQGFRAPNLMESVLLGDTGKHFHVPNDDLIPEQSDTFELLARGRYGPLTIGCTGYVSLLHDLIEREPTTWNGQSEIGGKDVAWNVNGGDGLLWGAEGEIGLDLGGGFSLAANLTYTWGEENVPDGPDEPLTRIPPLFGQLTFRYDTPLTLDWFGFAEMFLRAANDQDRLSPEDETDVRIPEGGTPGWWTLNLRAGVTVYDHLRLGLAVENLLDEDYKFHGSGLFSPGTNAILSLEGFF